MDHRLEEVVDRAVAHRRDPHPQAGLHQRLHPVRTPVGLAGAGRALDGDQGAVELGGPGEHLVEVVAEPSPGWPAAGGEHGQVAVQQRHRDRVGHSPVQHRGRQLVQRLRLGFGPHPVVADGVLGDAPVLRGLLRPEQVEHPGVQVPRRDGAVAGGPPGSREHHLVADGEATDVLLGQPEPHDGGDRFAGLPQPLHQVHAREPGQRLRVLQQVLRRRAAPGPQRCHVGRVLPAPVAEHVPEQVLDAAGAGGVQPGDLLVELGELAVGLELGCAPGQVAGPVVDEPVPQRAGGPHVVLVVVGDAGQGGLVSRGHEPLVLEHRARAGVDVVAALVVGEQLEVLQPVGLGADLDGVAGDQEQVDERAGVDQVRQRHLPHAVGGREAFQRGPLGVVVVVDVHARVRSTTGGQVLDEGERRRLLLVLGVRPPRAVAPGAALVALDEAEQEEQPRVGPPERVALEVEEHVAVVGFGQLVEAVPPRRVVPGRDEQVRRVGALLLPGVALQRGLGDQALLPERAQTVDVGGALRELGQGHDVVRQQGVPLRRPESRDVDQRVLGAPLCVADVGEGAEAAVLARHGESGHLVGRVGQHRRQLPPQASPVGPEVVHRQGLHDPRAEPQMHPRRAGPGGRRDGLGVEAQLQDVAGLGRRAGQLGVHRLPADLAVVDVGAHQEVGDAADAVVLQRHLVEHVGVAVEHRAYPGNPLAERLPGLLARDAQHPPALGLVLGQARRLVLESLVGQQPGEGAHAPGRRLAGAVVDLVGQGQEVGAVQPGGDLRRRDGADGAHASTLLERSDRFSRPVHRRAAPRQR